MLGNQLNRNTHIGHQDSFLALLDLCSEIMSTDTPFCATASHFKGWVVHKIFTPYFLEDVCDMHSNFVAGVQAGPVAVLWALPAALWWRQCGRDYWCGCLPPKLLPCWLWGWQCWIDGIDLCFFTVFGYWLTWVLSSQLWQKLWHWTFCRVYESDVFETFHSENCHWALPHRTSLVSLT